MRIALLGVGVVETVGFKWSKWMTHIFATNSVRENGGEFRSGEFKWSGSDGAGVLRA